ncbi:hypothetical protein [Emticicia sp. C21]|uniref:hypothetical protein n=1 Tax=Emticicia sp. C21 TaxID=2302915 RepID=UPI000E353B16|nr:hypothetical protein [Emticicia sp. C21]RFS16414.1 hypothetical protein D0T08_12065 [Emticicia sp. C21]
MFNRYKWLLIIVGLVLFALGIWYYFLQTKTLKKVNGTAEYDTLVQPTHYKKIPLKPFKYVMVNCDIGPVKVYLEADQKSAIEFHQTFMKYVEISYKGDTLLVHTLKTPKSTKENLITKQIYIHTPEISYYMGEATQTTLSNFGTDYMKVDNRSSYIRFYACEIKDLDLTTNKSCTFMLDDNSSFDKIDASINPNSAFICRGMVHTQLFLKANSLANIRFGLNVKKLIMRKYKP